MGMLPCRGIPDTRLQLMAPVATDLATASLTGSCVGPLAGEGALTPVLRPDTMARNSLKSETLSRTAPEMNVASAGPRVSGKFLEVDGCRFLIKGVTYGTFVPDSDGLQFPPLQQIDRDFQMMAAAGLNTVRVYTVPDTALLDAALRHGLKVMIGVPWMQHVAFLSDASLVQDIRRQAAATVRALASHPAALLFAVGNEIPPSVVRWHGADRVEGFLRNLYQACKDAAPSSLITYVSFPPTEYLDLDCFDVHSFNVYLHRETDLRAYLARLQHAAGNRPFLLAEAGADSIREGAEGQARITAMHVRAAFEEGAAGAVAFAWTDEWWRGGQTVTDWAFGLVDAERQPKPALTAVSRAFAEAPFSPDQQAAWPKVSVVVCAYNAADTIDDCLKSLSALTYPNAEIIVVNDGSRDLTGEIARRYPKAQVIDVPNGGLSAARNIGMRAATGEIVAYTDADVRVDPDWLTYLVQPILSGSYVGSGGPNVVPPDDDWVAQCVARAPGGPTQVLLNDRVAEHVPGCNMAFRRDALLSDRRLQPRLPPRRRRRGHLLAAPGPRPPDRVCAVGAGLAPPPLLGQGLLAAAGRIRRRRDLARRAPSREVRARPDAVAGAHLQPAAVPEVAERAPCEYGPLGDRGISLHLQRGLPRAGVPAALSRLDAGVARAASWRACWIC